jgi:hypothetical protein
MQSSLLGLWIRYSHQHNIIFLLVFLIYSLTLRKIQVKNGNILPFSVAGIFSFTSKSFDFRYKVFALEMLMFPVRWYVICTRKAGVHSIAW